LETNYVNQAEEPLFTTTFEKKLSVERFI
jgi:hypothetical protein